MNNVNSALHYYLYIIRNIVIIIVLIPMIFLLAGKIINADYTLSSTFMEWRFGHFHSGIDIRTPDGLGSPIYAPEDGYVQRVKVSPYGYGKALYLRGESGRIFVFAHLSSFFPLLEQTVRAKQISIKRYTVELWFKSNEFKVEQGDCIGFSGESGAGSPHIHYEIRENWSVFANPLKWVEVKDTVAPVLENILIVPESPEVLPANYNLFPLESNKYTTSGEIPITVPFYIGIKAADYFEKPYTNRMGLYNYQLFLNDSLLFSIRRDSFHGRDYNHIDSSYIYWQGERYQGLFSQTSKMSLIRQDSGVVRIKASDWCGNISQAIFKFEPTKKRAEQLVSLLSSNNPACSEISYRLGIERVNNHYYLTLCCTPTSDTVKNFHSPKDIEITFFKDSRRLGTKEIPPQMINDSCYAAPLILIQGTTKFVLSWQEVSDTFYVIPVYPGKQLKKRIDEIGVKVQCSRTYIPFNMFIQKKGEEFLIMPWNLPSERGFELGIKIPDSLNSSPIYIAKDSIHSAGAIKKDNWLWGNFSSGGLFNLAIDSIPPIISTLFGDTIIVSELNAISFQVADSASGFGEGNIPSVYLNGEWVPADYDYENDKITYSLLEPLNKGTYQFEVVAEDRVGNRRQITRWVIID